MREIPIYPKFYYCQSGVSDRDWIYARMRVIPDDKKLEVANRYEKLYLDENQGRKAANTYLLNIAIEYRDKRAAQ